MAHYTDDYEIAGRGGWRRGAVVAGAGLLGAGRRPARPRTARSGARSAGPPGPGRPPRRGWCRGDIARGARTRRQRGVVRPARRAPARMLERALPRFAGAERTAAWFRLGIVRSKLGRYREAAVAYAAVVADGAADSAVYSNFAEVLMAAGRLPDAEARYRDAISAANDLGVGDRRERAHELALAYYGLAVALDRDEQPIAARETMLRALAHDPTAAVLKIAATPGGDLFFVPDGDVLYYLGLAAEAEGRDGDAAGGLSRVRRARAARAAGRAPPRRTSREAGRRDAGDPARPAAAPRILAHGTVLATGGIAGAARRRRLARPARRFSTSAWTACACRRGRRCASRSRWTSTRAERSPASSPRCRRRSTSGLRAAWSRRPRRACAFRCPRPARPTLARTELIIGIPNVAARRDRACSQTGARRGIGEGRGAQREAALHRGRRADRRGQEQPRRDPGRRSCPRG